MRRALTAPAEGFPFGVSWPKVGSVRGRFSVGPLRICTSGRQRHWLPLLPFRYVRRAKALKDINSVSIWIKRRVCLLSGMKIMSPSRSQERQAYW